MIPTSVVSVDAPRPVRSPREVWRVQLALARIEGVRLLKHPVVLAGAALSAWLLVGGERGALPVLHVTSINAQFFLTPLAAAALLAANLGAIRAARHHTEELYGSIATSQAARTWAHLLAVVPLALVSALFAGVFVAVLAADDYAAGSVAPVELLTGPAAVAVAGALGVALARFTTALVAAPIAVLVLAIAQVTAWSNFTDRLSWLALVTLNFGGGGSGPVPDVTMLGRPAGWHLAYLLALAAVIGVAAVLRAGAARARAVAGGAMALAVLVSVGWAQVAHAPDGRGRFRPAAAPPLTCTTRELTTYCAYPGFTSRVPLWHAAVTGVRRALGGSAASRPLRVEQRYWADGPNSRGGGTGVRVGTGWPRGDAEGAARLEVGAGAARTLLGVPPMRPKAGSEPSPGTPGSSTVTRLGADQQSLCRPGGFGGVAWWAAAAADPDAAEALRETVRLYRQASESARLTGTTVPLIINGNWIAAEAEQGAALLGRPPEEVRRLIADNAVLLGDPGTTLTQAAKLFGVAAPGTDGRPCR